MFVIVETLNGTISQVIGYEHEAPARKVFEHFKKQNGASDENQKNSSIILDYAADDNGYEVALVKGMYVVNKN